MNLKYLTRFTYTDTNFQGWRVAIRRQGYTLTRYFSDRQYADPEIAYEHALRFRDMVLQELEQNPGNELAVLTKHRAQPKFLYPAGLKPNSLTSKEEDDDDEQGPENCACSVRSNKVMQGVLKKLCRKLQLDTASVLKLSLYLFSMQFGYAATPDKSLNYAPPSAKHLLTKRTGSDEVSPDLHHLIAELEKWARPAGLPSFEEFSTGRSSDKPINSEPLTQQATTNYPQHPHTAIPARAARSAIAYFNHFYHSQRLAVSSPISPRCLESELQELMVLHHSNI